jgi:esterase/lipase
MNYIQRDVTIESVVKLKGTLSIPDTNKEKFPGVLILCGSGEIDRNFYINSSQNDYSINLNSYKLLSDFLNQLGYATLRYDKRGVGESEGDFFETGYHDLLEDAKVAYRFLENQKEIDKNDIVIIGHSEGAMMINLLIDSINVKRAIMLAGGGISIKSCFKHTFMMKKNELIRESKGLKKAYIKLFGNFIVNRVSEKTEKTFLKTKENYVMRNEKKVEAKWYREHYKFHDDDYLNILKDTQTKILILTGEKDAQINPYYLDLIDALGNKHIKTKKIKDMNHQLRFFDQDITISKLKEQWEEDAKKPLHPKLLEEIEKWLSST